MKHLKPYMKKYKRQSILAPAFKMLEAGFDLTVPLLVARIIDDGIAAGNTQVIWSNFALMLLMALLGLSCSFTAQFFAAQYQVVDPFDLGQNTGSFFNGAANGYTYCTGQMHQFLRDALWAQKARKVKPRVFLGVKASAQTAAACGLLPCDHSSAFSSTIACQGFQCLIGGGQTFFDV